MAASAQLAARGTLGGTGNLESQGELEGSVKAKPHFQAQATRSVARRLRRESRRCAADASNGRPRSGQFRSTSQRRPDAAGSANARRNDGQRRFRRKRRLRQRPQSHSGYGSRCRQRGGRRAPAPANTAVQSTPGLGGSADQTATAGNHTPSGGANGSLDAQHSSGSTSPPPPAPRTDPSTDRGRRPPRSGRTSPPVRYALRRPEHQPVAASLDAAAAIL